MRNLQICIFKRSFRKNFEKVVPKIMRENGVEAF